MDSTANREAGAPHTNALVRIAIRTALAAVCASPLLLGSAFAQESASSTSAAVGQSLNEVTVTGSRIRREGFEAPTPVAVISTEALESNATSNLADTLNTMPNFQGSATPQSSAVTVTSGTQAVHGLNIGGLGVTRTLTLVNGQRMVGSTLEGTVDVSELPQQLITRVDVVTGGASASYGSDALTGVVNFVLDTRFTGVKMEVSAGQTNYRDNDNWKASASFGTPFANGRGHFIVSGEISDDEGLLVAKRPWNNHGYGFVNNPTFSQTNGEPRLVYGDQFSLATASWGGIINNTRGQHPAAFPAGTTIMFGPNGQQLPVNYGSLISGAVMSGGDWNNPLLQVGNQKGGAALTPEQSRHNAFMRVSWDLDNGSEIYFQASYGALESFSASVPVFYKLSWNVPGDNAFIPGNLAADLGCNTASSASCFNFGTINGDIGGQHPITDRSVTRFLTGIDGRFNLFQKEWTWDAYLSYGRSLQHVISGNTINQVKYDMAIDAVRDPNTGEIVCRSSLTNPGNGCVPLNLFGLGVGSQQALDYVGGNPWSSAQLRQTVGAVNVQGTPWQSWAGPIALAFGVEHRREETSATANELERAAPGVCAPGSTRNTGSCWFLAAGLPYEGSFHVSDIYVETNIPLAKELPFARALDLSAAVRGTRYSTSGNTGTWKLGLNWNPIDDLRFRFVRSLDIREPTLINLYQGGTTTSNNITDKRVNTSNITFQSTNTGNPNLLPERATNTIVGFVYQPAWLPRFNFSADYYMIDIKRAVNTLSAQQTYDSCVMAGIPEACAAYTVSGYNNVTGADGMVYSVPQQITGMNLVPHNSSMREVERLELAASYMMTADSIIESWNGNLRFRASATNYIKDIEDGGIPYVLPNDRIGNNNSGMPKWKYQFATMYNLGGFTSTLTMRGVSSGKYSNLWIECQQDCPAFLDPVEAANYITTSRNHIAGGIWFDLGLSYKFDFKKADTEVFFNVRNVADRDPAIVARQQAGTGWDFSPSNAALYDVLGRFYRAGFRIQF